jgi:glycosyltransferase involved in cell wall biosynthesis
MRVLHVSHTSAISGGEHSLLTLLETMPPEIELGVACPKGALADAVLELGLPVHHLPATSASFRLHPVRTARALAEIGAAAAAVRTAATRQNATVLHANSVRAGLIARVAGAGSGPPAVVHVRDVLPDGASALIVKKALGGRSLELIAISHYVEQKFTVGQRGATMTVIDNPVDQRKFDVDAYDVLESRRMLNADPASPLIGIVGQITPWKGHDTAIRALARVRAQHPEARLIIAGEIKFADPGTRLDNRAFLTGLHDLASQLNVAGAVSFLGERTDIPQVLRALDILLVPSTAEPFGRTVAEAMTMATPVIATSVGGPAELIEHGVSGLLAAPGNDVAWASAIDRLLRDRLGARQMATVARDHAMVRFDRVRHMRSVVEVLETVTAKR